MPSFLPDSCAGEVIVAASSVRTSSTMPGAWFSWITDSVETPLARRSMLWS